MDIEAIVVDTEVEAIEVGVPGPPGVQGPPGVGYASYIEIYLDQESETARSIDTINTDLDFALTYLSDLYQDFIYNDTTKEITYIGTDSILANISYFLTLERTDTAGSPLMTFFIKHDGGEGFAKVTKSISGREFTGNDTGTTTNDFMFVINPGDKLKMGLRVNAVLDINVLNILIIIKTVKRI